MDAASHNVCALAESAVKRLTAEVIHFSLGAALMVDRHAPKRDIPPGYCPIGPVNSATV